MDNIDVDLEFIMDKVAYRRVCAGKKVDFLSVGDDIVSAGDDLLSAGLGKFGLKKDAFGKKNDSREPISQWEKAPLFKDNKNPTSDELRQRAIYNNYRALVDMSTSHPTAYYGEIYGPGAGAGGGEGLIAGEEYIALTKDRVTVMVQIPTTFDVNNPCIITAPSSGSRGIYGAIGTAGEWGLKRGFAVAYTDKGTGIGVHNLMKDSVNRVTGERIKLTGDTDNSRLKNEANFIAISENDDLRAKALNDFNAKYKHRVAFKHAHSGKNPEKDWGKYVLQSIEFAIYILNKKFNDGHMKFTAKNTLVIASSVSNGGGASIRAAEQDTEGWIDGIAVAEPNVCPEYNDSFSIQQGESEPFKNHSKNLLEYTTLLNVYQPCASLAPELAKAPLNKWILDPGLRLLAENRCRSLYEKGLLNSEDLTQADFTQKGMKPEYLSAEGIGKLAKAALKKINEYGILPESNVLQPSHCYFDVYRSIAVVYANQYGRFDVTKNLCGYSFGATQPPKSEDNKQKPEIYGVGEPVELTPEQEVRLFSDHNGVPPFSPVSLINNESLGGHMEDRLSVSPSTKRKDLNLDGALRLHDLVKNSKNSSESKEVLKGIEDVRATGDLHGLPAIIVTGRSDAVLPPNHASRAYFGLNRIKEGRMSNLHYYEVTNAHHLDTLNIAYSMLGYFYTPLHCYFTQALDIMYNHLTKGAPLPGSQVIRTNPPIQKFPEIIENPGIDEAICFEEMSVKIPE